MLAKVTKAVARRTLFAQRSLAFSTASRVTPVNEHINRLDYATVNDGREDGPSVLNYKGPLKACILDWSGTTADAHVLAPAVVFVEVFRKHGIDISMAHARLPMGLRKDLHIGQILQIPEVRDMWKAKFGTEPTQQSIDMLFADFVPLQIEVLPKYTGLLPNVAETVSTLKNEFGLKIGSTTGFVESMVDVLLRDAKKQGYAPDSSVAGDTPINNLGFRPAPFMIYQNLLNLGVFPISSVLKVDDTVSGVGEGINAGCWSVGVYAWSNYTDVDSIEDWENMSQTEKEKRQLQSKEKLIAESGAHYVIRDMRELPQVVADINERMAKGETPAMRLPADELLKDQ